ncbi:MAG: Ig-like domain-containing protein [Bacteroides sp.]|nr:Ig-like domain-containing protein [Bacteroides sp.]
MNYSSIYNTNKRQFDSTLKRECITVSDYYDDNKTYKVFFRRNGKGTNPQGKLRFYYAQDTDIDIGTIFTLKDEQYLVISQDGIESDIYYTSMAVRCDTVFSVWIEEENRYVNIPYAVISDKYTLTHNSTISMVSGSVTIYTGLNAYAEEMKIGKTYHNFGGYYKVGNVFYNNGLAYVYMTRELQPRDTYSLTYNGVTSLDLKDSTYQLIYTAIKNGVLVENPILSYVVSDDTVATVSDTGLLTMLKDGNITVTAIWGDGESTSCSTNISIIGEDTPIKGTIILTGDTELQLGFSNTYTAKFINSNGEEVNDISPVWTITNCAFADFIEMTESGNEIDLYVEDEDLYDETFTLNVSDADGNFTPASMNITIASIF